MRYETRNNAFSPSVAWIIATPWLRVEEQGPAPAPPRAWALADVVQVRLEFSPTRHEPNRHRCQLQFRTGETREFFSRTYAGFLDFRDTSAAYVAFVRALHAALAMSGTPPACRFVAGVARAAYAGNLAIIAFVFAGLVALGFLLFKIDLSWLVLLKLLIVLAYLPTLFAWAKRNRPRTCAPGQIPADVLPRG